MMYSNLGLSFCETLPLKKQNFKPNSPKEAGGWEGNNIWQKEGAGQDTNNDNESARIQTPLNFSHNCMVGWGADHRQNHRNE